MTKRTLAQSILRSSRFARIASEFALLFVCLVASTAAQTPSTPDATDDVPASASSETEADATVVDAPPTPESDVNAAAPFVRRTTNLREKPTFWLAEENGAWRVPLPNWSLEEVMQTIDGEDERVEQTPYSIQKINAFGAVAKGVARLDVVFTVQVFGDELVRVPLGLQEGVYIPAPNGDGDGAAPRFNDGFSFEGPEGSECELDVDGATGAYVALVRPPREEKNAAPSDESNARRRNDDVASRRRARQYTLTLQLCFAVETLGLDEQRLVATFPASVNSQLLLAVPLQDAKFKSVKGAIQGDATPMDESTTNLTLHGLGRGAETTDVVWRKSKSAAEQNVVVTRSKTRRSTFASTLAKPFAKRRSPFAFSAARRTRSKFGSRPALRSLKTKSSRPTPTAPRLKFAISS